MYRTVSVNCLQAIAQMTRYTEFSGYDVRTVLYGNALIHASRNAALASVRPDAYALMVDDDMLPEQDAAVKLLRHEKPVVSGLCTTRTPPARLVCKVWKPEEQQFQNLGKINLEKPIEGQFAVGCAFLMISPETRKAVIDHVLSGQAAMNQLARILDFVEAPEKTREKLQRYISNRLQARYDRDNMVSVFDFPYDPMTGLQFGEDVAFSKKLVDLGIPVTIDSAVCPGHVGEYPFGVWDILAAEEKQERESTPEDDLIRSIFPSGVESFSEMVMKT